MEEQKVEEEKSGKRKKRGTGIAIALFLSIMLAAAFLLLWAWISYRQRYSAEVIRAGLLLAYILPCFAGGRFLRCYVHSHLPLQGALLGGLFYGVLLLCSAVLRDGGGQLSAMDFSVPALCVLSGAAGTIRKKKEIVEDRKT